MEVFGAAESRALVQDFKTTGEHERAVARFKRGCAAYLISRKMGGRMAAEPPAFSS
jgi:hypothetical protein